MRELLHVLDPKFRTRVRNGASTCSACQSSVSLFTFLLCFGCSVLHPTKFNAYHPYLVIRLFFLSCGSLNFAATNEMCVFFSELSRAFLPHEDVMAWKRLPHYWPFVRVIHRRNSHQKVLIFVSPYKLLNKRKSIYRWFKTHTRLPDVTLMVYWYI